MELTPNSNLYLTSRATSRQTLDLPSIELSWYAPKN